MDLGIIGLERSGKTTVFNAVTAGHAHAAAYGAMEPSIGVVKVPDERLDRLCELFEPRKVTHAEARYLDFPGGFSFRGGEPPAAYLAALSQCDALVHVVRAFRDDSVPHAEGSVDPERDIAAVHLEFTFADLAHLERLQKRLETVVHSARSGERDAGERELALLQRLRDSLEREEALRAQKISADERKVISGYQLLSIKPLVIIVNIDEADIRRAGEIEAECSARWQAPHVTVGALCGKLEQELTELSAEDAAEFRHDLGLEEDGPERMIQLSQAALGLISFFTMNEADGHAWTLPAGATTLEAAGAVHSDMARGFIRAEVIGWEELIACGSLAAARKEGKLRTEGKQYAVHDGELIHVLFNV